jgi:hypothetical protein
VFGRNDDQWDSLLDNAITVLKREAERRRTTSYSELNAELVRQTGQPAFDFSTKRDRTATGKLLGQVVEHVAYIDRDDAPASTSSRCTLACCRRPRPQKLPGSSASDPFL